MITNKEKETSIAYILEQGLVQPKSVRQQILGIHQQLGFRYLFWDNLYSLFFSVLTFGSVFVTILFVPFDYKLSILTISAPTLYLVLISFSEISERLNGLYELKQTLHYTIFQLTAFRILCYAFLGFILTTGLVLFTTKGVGEWLLALALSLFSLSLCTLVHLLVLRWIPIRWNVIGFSIIWLLCLMIFPALFGLKKWESFLKVIPLWSVLISCVVLLLLFIQQIKMMLQEVQKNVNFESSIKKIW